MLPIEAALVLFNQLLCCNSFIMAFLHQAGPPTERWTSAETESVVERESGRERGRKTLLEAENVEQS